MTRKIAVAVFLFFGVLAEATALQGVTRGGIREAVATLGEDYCEEFPEDEICEEAPQCNNTTCTSTSTCNYEENVKCLLNYASGSGGYPGTYSCRTVSCITEG